MLETWRRVRNFTHAVACRSLNSYGTMLKKSSLSTSVDNGRIPQVLGPWALEDPHSWNWLIKGYSKRGHFLPALLLYDRMRLHDSLQPSTHTFVALLKACAKLQDVDRGRTLHADIARKGLLEREIFVGSALVDMYAKCGSLMKAQEAFHELRAKNVVSWTALMRGYADNGLEEEALSLLQQMKNQNVPLDVVTYICALKACENVCSKNKGQEIHFELTSKGLEGDLVAGSTLIAFYFKCDLLAESEKVFDSLPSHDAVSWTSLIAGYADSGHGEKALLLFKQMQQEGFSPDAATFVCGLKASGSTCATERGLEIHAQIIQRKLESNFLVGSTLVDMYGKCGLLNKAQESFDKLAFRDVISWTALLTGYSQIGKSENVFSIYDRMIKEGMRPNPATFNSVLNACSHAGLLNHGEMYLYIMMEEFDLNPTAEHYTCIIDLLNRAGCICRAFALIKKMPCHPVIAAWHSLLGACQKMSNLLELGRLAFEHAVQLDEQNALSYLCMHNILLMEDNKNKFTV